MILDAEKSLMMHSTPGTFGIPNIRPLPGEDPLKDRGVMVHNLEQVLQCGLYTSGILLKIKKPIRQEILEGIYAKYAKIPYENSWLELAKPFISRFYIPQNSKPNLTSVFCSEYVAEVL